MVYQLSQREMLDKPVFSLVTSDRNGRATKPFIKHKCDTDFISFRDSLGLVCSFPRNTEKELWKWENEREWTLHYSAFSRRSRQSDALIEFLCFLRPNARFLCLRFDQNPFFVSLKAKIKQLETDFSHFPSLHLSLSTFPSIFFCGKHLQIKWWTLFGWRILRFDDFRCALLFPLEPRTLRSTS